jgi:hypothetical protein
MKESCLRDKVQAIVNVPLNSEWENNRGMNYEWHILETTVDRLSSNLVEQLKKYGCHLFNVDLPREPYYMVVVRATELY